MIDIEHKVLAAVKSNLENIRGYLNDKKKIKALMEEHLTIDSWNREERTLFYQTILNEVLSKYDINEFMMVINEFKYVKDSSDMDIEMFKVVIDDFFEFAKKVYEVYLLDQIYFLLASCSNDFIMDKNNIKKPFRTGSNLESLNFEILLTQISLIEYSEDIEIRLYNNKRFYLEQLNTLFLQKKSLYKKAYLSATLRTIICEDTENYFATQLFLTLNSKLDKVKSNNNSKRQETKDKNEMQLVLKNFN